MKSLGQVLMFVVALCAFMIFPNDEMSIWGMLMYYVTLGVAGFAGYKMYTFVPTNKKRGVTSYFELVPTLGDKRLNFVDAFWMNVQIGHNDGSVYVLRVKKDYFAMAATQVRHRAACKAVEFLGLRDECDPDDCKVSWDTEIGETAIRMFYRRQFA